MGFLLLIVGVKLQSICSNWLSNWLSNLRGEHLPYARHCCGPQIYSSEQRRRRPWSHGAYVIKNFCTHNIYGREYGMTQNFTSRCLSWRNAKYVHKGCMCTKCLLQYYLKIVNHWENLNISPSIGKRLNALSSVCTTESMQQVERKERDLYVLIWLVSKYIIWWQGKFSEKYLQKTLMFAYQHQDMCKFPRTTEAKPWRGKESDIGEGWWRKGSLIFDCILYYLNFSRMHL